MGWVAKAGHDLETKPPTTTHFYSFWMEHTYTQLTTHSPVLGRDCSSNRPTSGLPWWSIAGDAGSMPGQGTKIPHASEQRSPCTPTRQSVHHMKGLT